MSDWRLLLIIVTPLYVLLLIAWITSKWTFKNIFWKSLLFWYFIGVITITFFPLPIQKELIRDSISNDYLHNNFIPFATIVDIFSHGTTREIFFQIIGNLILTLPFGFLLPARNIHCRKFSKVWVWGFLLPVGIEFLQFIISIILGFTYKVTDIDDVLLNFIGFIFGYGVWKLTKNFLQDYDLI